MKLTEDEDAGQDLKVGDIVFIKFIVASKPTPVGDVRLQYIARNGRDEYASRSVNSIFLKRPSSRLMKWIVKVFCSKQAKRHHYQLLRAKTSGVK